MTDTLQIIATALTTVPSKEIISFLKAYCEKEEVEQFVLGYPIGLKSEETDGTKLVEEFSKKLKATFPEIPIYFIDERFTSKIAKQTLIAGGMSKKKRRVKENVDKVSAVIMLQDFLRYGK